MNAFQSGFMMYQMTIVQKTSNIMQNKKVSKVKLISCKVSELCASKDGYLFLNKCVAS